MKKWIALVCALTLICSCACGALAETNVFGWEIPEEPLKIDVFIGQNNWVEIEEQKDGAARMKQYLKDNFNIDYTYQTTDGEENEALNLALASGTYAPVIKGASTEILDKFVAQGRAIDLAPYIDSMPNFKKKAGDMLGMYYDAEGHLYYLPSSFGNLMDLPDYSAHIRYDEWLEIGSPEIKSPQDYFDAIMKIHELHPTTPNGETRYTLSMYNQGLPEYISGYWGLQRGWKVAQDGTLTYWPFTDEGKAMARFFNTWWRTGTMDPDSFVNKWDDLRTKISQERVIAMIGGWWIGYNAGHEIWSLTDENWTENKRFIQVGFKDENAENAYITTKNNLGSEWTILTDKCEDVEGVLRYIDFIMTDAGAALVNWGIPGEVPSMKDAAKTVSTWHIEGPASWHFDEEAKQELLAETWDYNDEGVLGANTGAFALSACYDRWDDGEHCVWPNQMWYAENKWKQIMFENMSGTIFDCTALLAVSSMPQDVAMAKTAVEDAYKQYYPLAVMAEDDDTFEAAWEALQDAMTAADVETYTQFYQSNYTANLEKMSK